MTSFLKKALLAGCVACSTVVAQAGGLTPQPTANYSFDHNGSLMTMWIERDRVAITYEIPRPEIAQQGVVPGTVIFEGIKTGNVLTGTAYVFRYGCLPIPYAVESVTNGPQGVLLEGVAPLLIHNGCDVVGGTMQTPNAHLYFQALPAQ